jgi:hypothetical protein
VWTACVVLNAPLLDDDLAFPQRVEELAVEAEWTQLLRQRTADIRVQNPAPV